ncbi:MAG TPA: CPBP family glutamic-type intramembrane protease [Bryobacteraceae bacterium]|nr:CPBP family glutamic-type intramembrane protease [Bryobacteraceae bacterium]
MKEKLQSSDYRFIAICMALLAGTVWFSSGNFYRAFPEASIDFRVNRTDGQALAGQFLSGQGYDTNGYRQASSFSFDDDAKTFLEREAGLEQANQMMGTKVRIWRWSYRWFRPLQKEEFSVDITPLGLLAGFEHELPEDAARPAVDAPQARALAEDFLRTRLHRDPASLDFVEGSDVARPHRVDRVFTWKERDFNLHDATNRVEVTVLGNEVGAYREYLKVPEQWSRDYQRLRSKNEMAQMVDSALLVAMIVGLVVVIVMRVRQHDIRWRRAAVVGVLGMVLSFCSTLNQFSLQEFQYPTTDSYSAFVTRQLLQGLISALGAGGLLFVLTAGAEPLYRELFPGKVSLGNLFRVRGLRTKRFFLGSILGITLTGIFIAYQTAFYIVAYKFGAWSPADVPYSDLLNTRFPWLFVLFGGFLPAVSEEFLFRMFGIPFFRKIARSLPVAVIAAGFIWGFGHSGYPQQPFFIRGMEVGIGGVALGLIMLRWGILPTLVWHYSVDAMYSAMLLVRSQSLYFKLSGAASAGIIVLPVFVALVAYWRRGGFEPETGLLNGDEGREVETPPEAAAEHEVAAATLPYQPLTLRGWLAAVLVLVAGLLTLSIPVSRIGESPNYKISEEQARAASDAFLRAHGLNPDDYRHVTFPASTWSGPDSQAGKYFLERKPVDFVSKLFEQYRPIQRWSTRYFKSLDREEVGVSVNPETGQVLGVTHTLPEDRPGADIGDDAARDKAAAFATERGWDLSAMDLKENASEKKKARRDHKLEWEARPGDPRNVDEANFRVVAEVDGDKVTTLRSYWKLPEVWSRARSQQNFISIGVLTLRFGMLAAGIVYGLILLIQRIRLGQVKWRLTIMIAIPAALLAGVEPLLSMKLTLQNYDTAIPLETFQATIYIVILMSVIFGFLLMGGAGALVISFFSDATAALRAANRRVMAIPALAALLAAIGMGIMLHQIEGWLLDRFHAQALFSIGSPDLLISAVPSLGAIANAVRSTIFDAAELAVLALIARRLSSGWMKISAFLLMMFVPLPLDIRTPGELVLQYGIAALSGLVAWLFCWKFARENYLAYALVFWAFSLRDPIVELLGIPLPAMHVHGWIVAAVLASTVLWALWPSLTPGKAVQAREIPATGD